MQQIEATGQNNKRNPRLAVVHAELVRLVVDGDPHEVRSQCPVCDEGVLAVNYAKSNGLPMVGDGCTECGQPVAYADEQIGGLRVWAPLAASFKFWSKERGGRDELPAYSRDEPYVAPARLLNPNWYEERKKVSLITNPPAPTPQPDYYADETMWSLGVWTKKQMYEDESDLFMVEPLTDDAPFEAGVRFDLFEGDKIVGEGKIVSLPPQPAMTLADFLERRDVEAAAEGTEEET